MGLSQLIMWSIIITTATTFNANNITNIQTADQAARALQPLVNVFPGSGTISKTIFALGIVGTGLLAIPVMAGASGYALSDVFGWSQGLNKSFLQAKKYYLIISASTIIGLLINFTNIDPIRALVYSSFINGIVAAPILVAVISVANDKKILKDKVNSKLSNVIGWTAVVIMVISVAILFLTWKQQ
jgi:Mn2+/Fe2+ NRAMP family transporter